MSVCFTKQQEQLKGTSNSQAFSSLLTLQTKIRRWAEIKFNANLQNTGESLAFVSIKNH